MAADPRVKSAARIAHTFRLDPVMVLAADSYDWIIRAAAHVVVGRDQKEAADKSSK